MTAEKRPAKRRATKKPDAPQILGDRPHAKLSPSGASRWMACPPSANLESQFPNTTSVYAEEGTHAHAICELKLRAQLDIITPQEFADGYIDENGNAVAGFDELTANDFYNEEMERHCEAYVEYVLEHFKEGSHILIEQRLDMTNYVPEGFGTGDALIMKDRRMDFIDLKYGKGVPVHARENKQLMLYALGAYNDFGHIFETEIIVMHIFQPRLDSISVWEISVVDLLNWAETELKEKALMAYNGEGEFKAGGHCGFCRAKAQCRALAEYNLELARHAFKDPDLMEDDELLEVLAKRKLFEDWISAVGGYVLDKARSGHKFTGWKLVEGRSVRKYADEFAVEVALMDANFNDVYTQPKLVGITELEKRLGKPKFKEIVEPLLIKPAGAPTLVPADDKRSEIASAADVFNDDASDLV